MEVIELTPERCPFTWTPAIVFAHRRTVRCTMRADEEGHRHIWKQEDEYAWTTLAKERFIEGLG